MSIEYCPQGYLNFETLFSKTAEARFRKENKAVQLRITSRKESQVSAMGECVGIEIYSLSIINREDCEKLKMLLEKPEENSGAEFSISQYKITLQKESNIKKEELIFKFQRCDNGKFTFTSDHEEHTKEFSRDDLFNLIHSSECQHYIRDALFDERIPAFVWSSSYEPLEIMGAVWVKDAYWYKLMIDGCYDFPNSSRKFNSVFFKKEAVERFLTGLSACSSAVDGTQRLFHLSTPWIEVMSHFSLSLGDKIFSEPKETLETDMKSYIAKHKLGIAVSDVQYLAKFIRDPEQKKGRAYQSRQKSLNLLK